MRWIRQNIYSEVARKKPSKEIASKYTISYQNKDVKESNVYKDIPSQIRLQNLFVSVSGNALCFCLYAVPFIPETVHYDNKISNVIILYVQYIAIILYYIA